MGDWSNMNSFDMLSILSERDLFYFDSDSENFLRSYLDTFKNPNQPDNSFENQVRSNIGCIGSAEFSVLRELLTGADRIAPTLTVLLRDAKVAVQTADTLRTRPCRTAAAAERGVINLSDLFVLSGDASKAAFIVIDNQIDLKGDPAVAINQISARLYGKPSDWENENMNDILDSGFQKYSSFFALMRLCVFRNLDSEIARTQVQSFRDSLLAEGEAQAGA
jgi:hypothetical protein